MIIHKIVFDLLCKVYVTIFRTMMPLLFCTGNFAADTQKCWNAGNITNQGGLPSDLNHWWAVNLKTKKAHILRLPVICMNASISDFSVHFCVKVICLTLSINLQSNPDKVLASVLCRSEYFIRTRTLSGLTFLWPCMFEIGFCNADPNIMYSIRLGCLNIGTPKQSAYQFSDRC